MGAGFGYQHVKEFLKTAITTEGEVIELGRHQSGQSSRGIYYYPVVRYKTSNGNFAEFISNTGSNPPDHTVGEKVTIVYNPQAPQKAVIKDFIDIWLLPIILFFLGVVFSSLGFLFWFFLVKKSPAPTSELLEHGSPIKPE